ncbi:hypothetical protein FF011L_04110 [Roseimaritima multifibrata]|uniref:Uncharacterized protein n=1 Tax=Roseimaritima multifibrata TaxID=1930274 RepID=A0A517M9W9_9BACT|nr:hypothetical protein FF011L_04110 [Roseimaritima multifibrata]
MPSEDRRDDRQQRSIRLVTLREFEALPGLKGRSIERKEITDLSLGCYLLLDNRHGSGIDLGYSLRPKMINAFLRTSRSRSTRRN